MLQQLSVVVDQVIENMEVGGRDLFGAPVASTKLSVVGGADRAADGYWVKGEIAPPYPDHESRTAFKNEEATQLRYGVLKQTLQDMLDPDTEDTQLLDCLDWVLQNDTGDLTFGQCCAAATKVLGSPVYPDFLRQWILSKIRDRILDLKRKARNGEFVSYFRGQGQPKEIIWVKGEKPPAQPNKSRLIVIEDKELQRYRQGVLKVTLEIMRDEQTCDEEFLDCLSWLLEDDEGGFSFNDCAIAMSVDGERCDPEFLRWRILRDMRPRIEDLKKKAKEGAFEHFFRFL
ncbi:MAG: hypothetical protein F8N36_14025 [Desulfovibrio sp.]|uniref:hypothetical protein n=1 Tax=Desulfovibrio sp. TaxID=885 RepID=UPI00135D7046|nr:hypothetical protein [Desulfovibrio sp.]MTJ93956.1 hypothetical protein [Desulfovibrio sp.]